MSFFFFKQKTAYEMRISDWSSDVCSSDLDVWICPDPGAHLQATGRDARGRKQYRYHPDWRARRDQQKFQRMAEFADALPRLRRKINADLRADGLPQTKVLAVIAALLDTTQARVGNEIGRASWRERVCQ